MEFDKFQKLFIISVFLSFSLLLLADASSQDSVIAKHQSEEFFVRHFVTQKYDLSNQTRKFLTPKDTNVVKVSPDETSENKNEEAEGRRRAIQDSTNQRQEGTLPSKSKPTVGNSLWQNPSEHGANWVLEFRNKFQPRLTNILTSGFTELLKLLISFTTRVGLQLKADPFNSKPHGSSTASFLRRYLQAKPFKHFFGGTPRDGIQVETGRRIGGELSDRSTEDFVSDQESIMEGKKPYRLRVYKKRSGWSGNRAGFGYVGYVPSSHTSAEDGQGQGLDKLNSKRSPYRRKPKYENYYRDPNGIADKVNPFDTFVGSSKGEPCLVLK